MNAEQGMLKCELDENGASQSHGCSYCNIPRSFVQYSKGRLAVQEKMNTQRLETHLREYVRNRLLAPRGLAGCDFDLLEPRAGVKTFVRLVELQGHPGFALRVYPSWERRPARRRLEANRLIERHGLPGPRIVAHRLGLFLLRPTIVAEERLRGRHVAPGGWTSEMAARLAEALARFHSVSSGRHGPIDKPSAGRFFDEFWGRVRHRLRGVRRRCAGRVSARALAEAARWFRAWANRFQGLERFDLLHDKLNPGNVLWLEAEGRFALLDFETMQFGCRVKDLVQAEHDVLFEEEEAVHALRGAYLPRLPEPDREFAERVLPFFHAYYHLSEASTTLKRARRARTAGLTEGAERRLNRHWAEMERIVGESSLGNTEY